MVITRRTALLWGGLLAVLGATTYELRPRERTLETDPQGETFIYRDGIITRVET